ncbi:beta-hexosaminidase subunit beta-like [Lineus longissimus]|uniref:beta-hexosaminidase subunit beta-like n=1 Tax=Lineus longissimus TaxID=88925 RepID=UPI00315DC389
MADGRKFLILQILVQILLLLHSAVAHLSGENENKSSIRYGITPTVGMPWPAPKSMAISKTAFLLEAENFQFRTTGQDCDIILEEAYRRYYGDIFYIHNDDRSTLRFASRTRRPGSPLAMGLIEELDVNVLKVCEKFPSLGMDESYHLQVQAPKSLLNANTVWGALRGLETFAQTIYQTLDGEFMVNGSTIDDAPRFSHRGLLIDTSRHFVPKSVLYRNLEAMSQNKMNVFHWHIVDDQSFPYESKTFPDLNRKGAFEPHFHVYTQEDVAEVIEYARLRGIRVVPEFDTPGHTESWGPGQPGLLTKCYSGGKPSGSFGPIDPSVNTSFAFMEKLLKEIFAVFPDKYVHLGGDEVSFTCWQSNPIISSFMKKMGFGTDYSKLEQYYMQHILNIIDGFKSDDQYIIWQEVIDNGCKVSPKTVVEVWKGGYQAELAKVTKMGLTTLLSSCWYLNYISYGSDWTKYYACDPQDFTGTDAQKALVIGGEACMWGEFVDGTNLVARTWPRASAVAERLWSPKSYTSTSAAAPRLEEQRCRMLRRGLVVEPVNGPGWCLHEVHGRRDVNEERKFRPIFPEFKRENL